RAIATAFEGDDRVERIRTARLDDARRPIDGGEFTLDADLVLLAIGQSKLGERLAALEGIALDRGRVAVDDGGATGRGGWYAGGDCVNGGKEVVNAVAEGDRAALAIDAWFAAGGGLRKGSGA
ncbi:MAG: FAD-dependent oxidoreductase, partial [Planctomycetota bacterium]|nr:FAD-dependent oxidoreductase [Planctomycetota bacterium]